MALRVADLVKGLSCRHILVRRCGIQQTGVLGADGNLQIILNGMKKDEVAKNVSLTESKKLWPLLSSRLNRLLRQNPMSRVPAAERFARIASSMLVAVIAGFSSKEFPSP